jgi:hypothetical protein
LLTIEIFAENFMLSADADDEMRMNSASWSSGKRHNMEIRKAFHSGRFVNGSQRLYDSGGSSTNSNSSSSSKQCSSSRMSQFEVLYFKLV